MPARASAPGEARRVVPLDALSVRVIPDASTMASPGVYVQARQRVACPPASSRWTAMSLARTRRPAASASSSGRSKPSYRDGAQAAVAPASSKSKISVGEVAAEHDVSAIRRRPDQRSPQPAGPTRHKSWGTVRTLSARLAVGVEQGAKVLSAGLQVPYERAGSAAAAPIAADPRCSAAALLTTPDPRRDARPPHDRAAKPVLVDHLRRAQPRSLRRHTRYA